jgi:RNA recognition motif-containing protein
LSKCLNISSTIIASYSVRDLHVGRIPGSVTYNQLQQLFPQATSIEYRQGKITHDQIKLGYEMGRIVTYRFLYVCFVNTRFAFLHFADIQSATQVIEHADEYHIDNQPLTISYKLLKNTDIATSHNG